MTVPAIALNGGTKIPQLGFGVFQIDPAETQQATECALETGYRHIDTAQMYGNEKEVGAAVAASGINRDEVFVTSKLHNDALGRDDVLRAFDATLGALGLDYLDLFLVHWPLPGVRDFVKMWHVMEEIYQTRRAKAIGVSNFQPHHLCRLLYASTVVPAVNQIEVHPYLTQDDVRAVNARLGIVTEAWSPIAQGAVLDDPVLERIAEAHDRTTAQVTLRWHVQRGDVVLTKSVTPHRVRENFAIFDFELSAAEMNDITDLHCDERIGPDPDTFNGDG